jgi:methyl coenzyme M reductase subunit D
VTVTQIRSDRVSVLRVGSPKRSILQTNDLEVELQVEAGKIQLHRNL